MGLIVVMVRMEERDMEIMVRGRIRFRVREYYHKMYQI